MTSEGSLLFLYLALAAQKIDRKKALQSQLQQLQQQIGATPLSGEAKQRLLERIVQLRQQL